MITEKLDSAIKAVCPIYGVSVGTESDKATWKFFPKEEATEAQIQDGMNILSTFVYTPPTAEEEKTYQAQNLIDYKTAIVALADVTFAVLKDPTKLPSTRDAWLQAIKDRYKALI